MHFTMKHNKSAFTMIELIFVIVIIGILTAIALPRLSAVRDDAKIATNISNMAMCIREAGSIYTASGVNVGAGDVLSCDEVVCYTITYATNASNFTVVTNPDAAIYCSRIDSIGKHLERTYDFKGSKLSF